MKRLLQPAVALALLLALPGLALAQQTPTATVGDAVDFRSNSTNYAVDVEAAIAGKIAREHGYGPGTSTLITNVGTQNVYSTTNNNGPQNTTSAANVLNSNTVSTSNSVGSNSPGFSISVNTGSSQYSGTASQTAQTQNTIAGTAQFGSVSSSH